MSNEFENNNPESIENKSMKMENDVPEQMENANSIQPNFIMPSDEHPNQIGQQNQQEQPNHSSQQYSTMQLDNMNAQQQNNVNYTQNMDNNHFGESKEALKARTQAEKEKAKFEQKRAKIAKKMEKKAVKKAKRKENRPGFLARAVTVTVSAVAFGAIALGVIYFGGDKLNIINKDSKITQIASTKVETTTTKSSDDNNVTVNTSTSSVKATDVSGVVEEVMPSIVAITSKQKVQSGINNWYDYYFGGNNSNNSDGSDTYEETGAGSGIIIGQNDTELLIITNNHVVANADTLEVQFIDDESVDALVKGTNSSKDLAVVSVKLSDIKESTLSKIKVASLGSSDDLKVGDAAIAIGNALGYGQSVTTGVISALNREVTVEDNTMTLLQTDAAINPGNSGGALLNMNGEVIGINAAKYSSDSVEGMGFAIPISSVQDIIGDLMNKETLTKVDEAKQGYINIYGRDVTPELSQMYSVPEGVYVVDVIDNGAAQKAGIEKSDVITAVNGESVGSMDELQEKLAYYEEGKEVTLKVQYLKDKKYVEKEVKVTLGGKME